MLPTSCTYLRNSLAAGNIDAYVYAHGSGADPVPKVETNTKRIIARLVAEGWMVEGGSRHTKLGHPGRAEKIMVPRHRTVSEGVARQVARAAGWI